MVRFARIRSRWALHGLTPWELLKRVVRESRADEVLLRAPALAFFFLLAVFPFLFFVSVLLGYLIEGGAGLERELYGSLSRLGPGSEAATLLRDTIEEIRIGADSGKAVLGLLGALWAASMGMEALIGGLNTAYNTTENRPWWRQRLLAVALTVVFTVFAAGALALLLFGELIGQSLSETLKYDRALSFASTASQALVGALLAMLSFDLLYNFAPRHSRPRPNQWLTPGALTSLALWLLASWGFRLYLADFSVYGRLYGSLGTVIVLLIWCFLTAAAVLIGAEVNAELDRAAAER